jgi:hypothetical protein
MIAGIRGPLISAAFADTELHQLPGAAAPPAAFITELEAWHDRRHSMLGPSSSVRAVSDGAVIPLLRLLGYEVSGRDDRPGRTAMQAVARPSATLPVTVTGWNEPLDDLWRDAVREGIRADARWSICCNGSTLRVVDAHRTWARAYVEFDLALAATEVSTRSVLWNVLWADGIGRRPSFLELAAEGSARHGVAVCNALGEGVLKALRLLFGALSGRQSAGTPKVLFEQSLTVLYRVLFLLFAEARGLVPIWHPIYRERYTIDAVVTTLMAGRTYRGIWDAVLAISRLAHAGCRAGELRVTAFNGRLFSPAHSSQFDRRRISDAVMGQAVLALGVASTSRAVPRRIVYSDLDVEQLGAVYERVLEYEPVGSQPALTRTRDTRQSSGSFYTPRTVTAVLVRQTLEPLVRHRTASEILELRVVDPAMGSGAFLVAACRYLAGAAEEKLIQEGRWHPGDVTPADRAALRREIAQRCLFGVDLNPMAVQLARLSLWLATLASDRPLTFLDHHLVAGDSLIGASVQDVRRQPAGGDRRQRRPVSLPLFDVDPSPVLEQAVRTRLQLTRQPDDSAAIVAEKTSTLAVLHGPHSPLGRWSKVLDLWCAGWFWERGRPPSPPVFADLCNHLLHQRATLSSRLTDHLLDHGSTVAAQHRFLHWPLTFPEVFCGVEGDQNSPSGFDAVIGNPPWDMVRGDSGEADVRTGRKLHARQLADFVREAGVYSVDTRGHVNRYQLFVERALQLTRAGGRIGLVLPSGVVADSGAAALRRHLFDRAEVDRVTGLNNRGGLFAIHRSLRFVLLSATTGRSTKTIACRFGVTRADDLDAAHDPIVVTRGLLARVSGADDLAIPELVSNRDFKIVEAVSDHIPWLSAASGWNVRFGRELNATDDRRSFVPFSGRSDARPVLEGKYVQPFQASPDTCRYELAPDHDARSVPRRARLAYRDVASATNRLTLIAAVIPGRAVTTHTLFCLRTRLGMDAQHVLCALLNSFVANYLIRLRVNTHVTASLVSRLPVPFVGAQQPAFSRLALHSRALAARTMPAESMDEYADLQALAARLYGVDEADFTHILTTFPLIPEAVREQTLQRFCRLS